MVTDMTTGDPIRRILRFFIPVLLGNLLQQFYSMADSAIVSRYLGVEAFAGVRLPFVSFGIAAHRICSKSLSVMFSGL